MTKPIPRDPIYRKRGLDADIIELCVRWYITYRLSYRDLVQMMPERGVVVAHSTILRWVARYVPKFEKRWSRFAKPVGTSWRVDETYICIRGKWHYLYRAEKVSSWPIPRRPIGQANPRYDKLAPKVCHGPERHHPHACIS